MKRLFNLRGSLGAIIAFNSAVNQMKQNQIDAANLEGKRTQNAQSQEDLDTSKALDVAKVKQAHVMGQISDVTSDAITDAVNKQYKAHQDVLDAQSDVQDNLKLKMQGQQQQLGNVIQQTAQDPDVQNHMSNLLKAVNPNTSTANPTTNAALSAPLGQGNAPASNPMQAGQNGINPNIPSRASGVQQPSPSAGNEAGSPLSPQTQQQPISPNVAPSNGLPLAGTHGDTGQTQGGTTTDQSSTGSPLMDAANSVGKAFGMPAGAMWINPSTGSAEMNPIYLHKMEALNRAQANYDVNHPYTEVKNQETLEKQYADRLDKGFSNRSGGLGLMDSKVNQATLAQQLLDQYYDKNTGEYHVPQAQYTDLAISLATLLAPGSQASDSKVDAIKQKTLQGDYNGVLQYVTGSPKDATTPQMIQNLADSIKREGLQAEKQRDVYLGTLRAQAPSELDPSKREYLEQSSMYPSFKDYLKMSPSQQKQQGQQGQSTQANNQPTEGQTGMLNGRQVIYQNGKLYYKS